MIIKTIKTITTIICRRILFIFLQYKDLAGSPPMSQVLQARWQSHVFKLFWKINKIGSHLISGGDDIPEGGHWHKRLSSWVLETTE